MLEFPVLHVTPILTEVKKCLAEFGGFEIRFEGEEAGTWYRNIYRIEELDIKFGYETSDLIPDDETFQLEKPLCVLYRKPTLLESGSVDTGIEQIEFQIVVNFAPQGLLHLTGYQTLLQTFLNPRHRKGTWLRYGLAPRRVEEGPLFNGRAIYPKLRDRILVQSTICTFTTVEDTP